MPFIHRPHSCENSSNLHLSENENPCVDNILWLFRVSSLKHLYLGDMGFQKEIDWLQSATLLSSFTELSWDDWLGQLEHLQELIVDRNIFSGPIPSTLRSLSSLTALDVSSNYLKDILPESLGNLSSLTTLDASSNYLSESSRKFWATLELGGVRAPLQKNRRDQQDMEPIKGNDSEEDESLSAFYFGLGVGFATAFWGVNIAIFFNRNFRHSYIRFLYHISHQRQTLCYNSPSDELFPSLDTYLALWLGGNNLTGTVLPSISFLSNLKILHLNNNNFFGEIPMSLKNCQNLQILDVAENKFSGFIPNWIGHNVKIIQFRSNQFSGTIPSEVCQLESLTILDFANNKLSGSIPSCLHNMTAMRQAASSNVVNNFCGRILCSNSIYGDNVELHIKGLELIYEENVKLLRAIDLSSNYMSGTIPPEMFSLSELHSLNLSHNQLEGNILREIGNLKQLESLDLAHNQFSDFVVLHFQRIAHKDVKPTEGNYSEEDEFLSSFYIGIGVGFAVAFWGVCAVIFFNNNFSFLLLIGSSRLSIAKEDEVMLLKAYYK
ncbi:receptor-like protein 33 [Neltuma alba]|uniref:receptor-like protein 33 n=1 Tax=Neltuma alba TaxID=207710 RepID=UPI0010A3CF13|nr:receptor-like protein 33 [Prosopis alba]